MSARKRDIPPFKGVTRRWFARVEWKVQDAWIGVYSDGVLLLLGGDHG